MKINLSALLATFVFCVNASASPMKSTPTYLACIGTQPTWMTSWAAQPFGMDKPESKLTIKLWANSTKATIFLGNLGEQEFDLQNNGEYYFGETPQLNLSVLDGRITKAGISINRINGETSAYFEVTSSPKDGQRMAFSGNCAPASPKF